VSATGRPTAARITARIVVRRLAGFLVLGAALCAGKHLVGTVAAGDEPVLVVQVPTGAGAEAIRRATVDAALVDEAVRARWPLADPVVRERLLEAMHRGGGSSLLARTVALRLTAVDPTTRARLAWLGRELVRARTAPPPPAPGELAAYRAAHPERYAPGWLAFRQQLVGRARHGDAAETDARALVAALRDAGADAGGGDPTLLPARTAATPAAIDARFGPGFAAQLATAPVGAWSGPYPGAFGYHVIWREAATAPPGQGDEVDARVARDRDHDAREREIRRAIDDLVRRRRVVVREEAR
jgi:hypothetical protein